MSFTVSTFASSVECECTKVILRMTLEHDCPVCVYENRAKDKNNLSSERCELRKKFSGFSIDNHP